ncbi:universal stress protein [Halomicrobium urmianum]|uniref:universal stress protein n=1 Tax=Halomicrobium urmianum TaxID=1586233 RepID=UPI001CD93D4C|nr:universal stress protein [Halomicrobium urmianum]
MERALVVLNGADGEQELVERALRLADGVGATVEFFAVFTPDEYEEAVETLDSIADVEQTGYDVDAAFGLVRPVIEEGIESTGADVDYELSGEVAEGTGRADAVLGALADRDCDHVFVAGQERSPTGKAVFGDAVQSVLLNAAVPVTTLLN